MSFTFAAPNAVHYNAAVIKQVYTHYFKPIFEYKITSRICVLELWTDKGYFLVKKLLWNVRIKAFLYKKKISDLLEKLVLKLASIWKSALLLSSFAIPINLSASIIYFSDFLLLRLDYK